MTHLSPPLKLKHDKLKVLPSEPTTLLPLEKHSVVISASTHSFLIPGASSPSLHPWGAQPPLIPYSLTHKRAIFFFFFKKQKLSKSIGVMKEDTQKYTPFPYPTEPPFLAP